MGKHTPSKLGSVSGLFVQNEELVPELPNHDDITAWINSILSQERKTPGCIYYVFTDDNTLLDINRKFLDHDTYTDIITFPYQSDPVEAEIYISIDRVRANAEAYAVPVIEELLRVMAHGILHVCGWRDKTPEEHQAMRSRENACLTLWSTSLPVSHAYVQHLSSLHPGS